MANPTTQDFTLYKGNTFGLVFNFLDSAGAAIDIDATYTSVTLLAFKYGRESDPAIEYTIGSGLTLSDVGTLTAKYTPEQVAIISAGRFYYQLKVELSNGDIETFLDGRLNVVGTGSGQSQSDEVYDLTINQTTNEVTVTTGNSAATALDAATRAENAAALPTGVILVDGSFTDNESPKYETIDDALTAANAMLSGGYSKVIIKAFLDADKNPIGLGTNDMYGLQEQGIYFESDFSDWDRFVRFGGDIDNENILYNIINNNLKTELVN